LLTLKAWDVPCFKLYHFCFVYGATSVFCCGYYTLLPIYYPTVCNPPAKNWPIALKPYPIILPVYLIVAFILSAPYTGYLSMFGQC